jgi:selenocysteine lyase/cysteine desulfurase
MVAPFLPDEEKVAAIREALPATGAGIYLDTATAGPLPIETHRAMQEWADWELRVGRVGDEAEDECRARLDEARGVLAAVLVAPIERVDVAPDVGSAFRAAAAAMRWRRGERIVALSSLEPAVHAALAALTATVGGQLVEVEVPSAADDVVELVARAVMADATLVAVPHVSPVDGTILPVAELAGVAHGAGARIAVDGSLAVGAMAVDAPGLGADVYAAQGDRWLCGPSGMAAAFVAGELTLSSGAHASLRTDLHRAAVVGLGRSAGWLAMQVGLEWAFLRARRLLQRVANSLVAIPGVTLLAPVERVSTALAFRVDGWPTDRLRDELSRRAHAVVGRVRAADAVRVSVGCWNTEDEIDRFGRAVAELAAITPEDAARRRPPLLVVPGDRS